MFIVMSHCSKILHQFSILNISGVPILLLKTIIPGANATFCNVGTMHVRWSVLDARFFSVMKFSMSLDISLSNLWSWGR